MVEIIGTAHVISDPAGIGQPTMAQCEMVLEKQIVDSAREGDVNVPPEMNVADLSFVNFKLTAAEPMRRNRDLRPTEDVLFENLDLRRHLVVG